jgi:hypothetical protein
VLVDRRQRMGESTVFPPGRLPCTRHEVATANHPTVRRNIATAVHHHARMFWTGFFIGFAACLAIGLTAHFVHDRRERAAFIAGLSPAERERLMGFETVKGDWRAFRNLLS